MRQFYSSLPQKSDEGGLSSEEQANVIHHGIMLEKTILQLIGQYNIYIRQIGIFLICRLTLFDRRMYTRIETVTVHFGGYSFIKFFFHLSESSQAGAIILIKQGKTST